MKIHFIEDEKKIVAFHPETFDFFVVEPMVRDVIEFTYTNGINSASKKFNITEEEIRNLISELGIEKQNRPELEQKMKGKVLNRLVLNVSNSCNLSCKYCYANGGSYHSGESLMTEETAVKALDLFFNTFDKIENIQIFGGEPLMNEGVVHQILDYFEAKDFEEEKKPKIGIVTNGTYMNDKMIDRIQKLDITVTISMDGGKEIHDCNRVDNFGVGTFDRIVSNVKRLREETGQPDTIEVTYNNRHRENGVKVLDTIRQLNAEVPGSFYHITPVSSQDKGMMLEDFKPFIDSVDEVFDSFEAKESLTYSLVDRFVRTLQDKQQSHYVCNAGFNTISVSVEGDVYPCFMFTDVEEFKMGNISDEGIFKTERFKDITQMFFKNNKLKHENCQSCMLQRMCTGCLGYNYYETNDISVFDEKICSMYVEMAKRVILRFADIHQKYC